MTADIPIVDLDAFLLSASPSSSPEAIACASALVTFGAVIVRWSALGRQQNDAFLDMVEDYFAQPASIKDRDTRPELNFQVGATLESTEKPVCSSSDDCRRLIASLEPGERPLDLHAEFKDPKCRWFHKMQVEPPYVSAFPSAVKGNVEPQGFPEWIPRMDEWGRYMRNAVEHVADMASLGFGLPINSFRDKGKYCPFLVAPTASDLTQHGGLNTILAGFHTDLNFLTIHGRSRYPGLHIWARNSGKRIEVKVPEGCLLVQAGKQMEYLTGGVVKAGYHEVVVNENTVKAMVRRKVEHPDRPLIRVSTTAFWSLSSDIRLEPEPLPSYPQSQNDADVARVKYPPILVGNQVLAELGLINLSTTDAI